MNDNDIIVVKTALKALQAAGDTGLKKADVLNILDRAHGEPLAADEQETFFNLAVDRGWVTSYIEPIWHNRRYRLTPRGMTALEGM